MRGAHGVDAAVLRRYAVARTLVPSPTAPEAVVRLGFVQYDPIRPPACAQDLILRHRVAGYRAGDLERTYASLPVEEDFFVNYGVLPRELSALMHPRTVRRTWSATTTMPWAGIEDPSGNRTDPSVASFPVRLSVIARFASE